MEKKTDFRTLSNKAKIQFIWDYYRLHILVAALALIIIFALIHHFVTYREPVLNVIMINTLSGDATSEDGFDEFLDAYGYNKKESPISVFGSLYFVDSGIAAMDTYTNYELLSTMVAVGGQDVFLGTGDVFLDYAKQGAFADLSTILSQDLLNACKDSLLYSTDDGETASYPCAVEITDNDWLKRNNYYDGSCYFAILFNSENPTTASQFAEFLLTQ